MNLIPLIIYAAELALAAIILFYVVELLPMPKNMKRVCQMLIILIAVLAVLTYVIGGNPAPVRVPSLTMPNIAR